MSEGLRLEDVKGIGDKSASRLREHGIGSVEQLVMLRPEELSAILGVSLLKAKEILMDAKDKALSRAIEVWTGQRLKEYREKHVQRIPTGIPELDRDMGGGFPTDCLVSVGGCYDENTEVLTKNGWKFWKDVTLGDELATLDEDGYLIYVRPTRLIAYHYRGKMYRIKTKHIDLLVTPDHQMYVSRPKHGGGYGAFRFIPAKDVFGKRVRYKKDALWKGERQEFFILPAVKVRHRLRNGEYEELEYPEVKIPMEKWLRFLGFWLTDGHVSTWRGKEYGNEHCRVALAQVKPEYRELFRASLAEIASYLKRPYIKDPPHVIEERKGFYITNRQLYEYLKKLGKKHERVFPREILNLDRNYLKIIFDALILGDGCRRKDVKRESGRFYTSSPHLKEAFEELCLKLGYAFYTATDNVAGDVSNIGGRKVVSKRTTWVISFTRTTHPIVYRWRFTQGRNCTGCTGQIHYEEGWVDYDGMVYCAEVLPTHLLYVRRNGKPVWCGNSSATGKSQLMYTLAVNAIGLLKRPVFLIETEPSTLAIERILEIASARGVEVRLDEDLFVIPARFITSPYAQYLAYEMARKTCREKGLKPALIGIDSFSSRFRGWYGGRETLPSRSQEIARHITLLQELASEFNSLVYLSEQVYGVPDAGGQIQAVMKFGDARRIYGGEYLLHAPSMCMMLVQTKADEYSLITFDVPFLPKKEYRFRITERGVEGVG
jgi:RecA/RadA recombinase